MASSSSSQEEYKYDVFLSFRGEDTRRGFTRDLYDALCKKNIRTFMDDEKAKTGYKISPQLRKAIMGSKIWIIVFSKDFASSTWCLDEVLQILECNRNKNEEINGNVIPIFYGIKPTIVRKQKKSYAVAFAKHEECFKDRIEKVQQWRDALNEVASVTGHDSENFRYDHELIGKIVNDVLLKLPKDQLTIDHFKKNLIGIEERVKDIESFLCIDSEDDVRIIGIWGMGGIGKTTLASTVFDIYKSSFDAYCFLKNVREESKRQGKEHLRKILLFGLLNDESILKNTASVMLTFIQKRLCQKKVIVVLDDMDEILSLKYFLEGHEQFATGSRIIVTTRDVQLLRSVTDKIYKVKGLDYSEALKLFHNHAFGRQISVAADHETLSKRAITRANGNPLALKVLGSFLCSKSKQQWESALDKQAIDPHKEILQVLKISYDGLSKGTQNMFLDIACFITGEVYREEVENMFSCGDHYDVTIEITDLIDKSLLTKSHSYGGVCLSMHDLLREMGQKIVRDESEIPGNRSRLWTAKDVRHVLEKNKGTDAIQGILLNLSDRGIKKNVQVSRTTFSKMCHLRYLKIYEGGEQYDGKFWPGYLEEPCRYNIYAPEGLFDISDELRYFHWDSYPLKYLPNFSPENLVGLIMHESKLEKLWNDVQLLDLEKLKKIDLRDSEHLTEIPNLSGAINLEIINLQGCKNLVEIHLNLQNLRKLQILNLSHCYNLEKCGGYESQEVPSSVPVGLDFSYCTRLTSIHRNEVQLKEIDASYCEHLTEIPNLSGAINLETIRLRGCKRLGQVALNFQNHPKLRILDLRGCDNFEECRDSENIATNNTAFIEEETSSSVPVELNFSNCKRLRSIPESFGKLKYLNRLDLSECPKLEKFPEISSGSMDFLHELLLGGTGIEELPESIENIKKLKHLSLKDCKRLKSIPQSIWKLKYLENLIVSDCPNLQGRFPEIWDVMGRLYELDLGGTGIEELPGSIENIISLKHLSLKDCKRLKSLPQSIRKLRCLGKLILPAGPNLQGQFPEIWDVMECLYEVDLWRTGIEELPESIENIEKLIHLSLKDCKRLKSNMGNIYVPEGALCKQEHSDQGNTSSEAGMDSHSDSLNAKGKNLIGGFIEKRLTELGHLTLKDDSEGHNTAHNLLVELTDCVVDFQRGVSNSKKQVQQGAYPQSKLEAGYPPCNIGGSSSPSNSFSGADATRTSCPYAEMSVSVGGSGLGVNDMAQEGPSDEGSCYHLNNHSWLSRDDHLENCSAMNSSSNELLSNDWGRCGMPPFSFVNIFEAGSLLYCDMSFEALLNARKQLEELGFPCKAVNDGLWLQMLLSQRVQEIGADTCKNCCLMSMACVCRQPFGFTHGVATSGFSHWYGMYMQEHDQNNSPSNMGNVYVAESAPGDGNDLFRPVRVHVRGPVDGLAGIGRVSTFVPAAAWPPTRFVFSPGPFVMRNRNCQQSPANDDSEARADHNGDLSGDGLTALVGLSQGGGSNSANINGEQTVRGYEMDLQNRISGTSMSGPSTSSIPVQMLESSENAIGVEWENANSSSISLDMKTPLSHFPPFRFGVQFQDVHRLSDGEVKHSPEVFYAGSFWKVSVQAFNDEDPQGRRTLGLFLHRRKAEITDSLRKVHMYVDSREKVTARYQLICATKREVVVLGSFRQRGTLLPKAPKGWGWRTALLFDELADLLQNGSLRVAAVVELV